LDNGLKAQKWIFEEELARASRLVYVGNDQRQNAQIIKERMYNNI
jgi:hypothetical protein